MKQITEFCQLLKQINIEYKNDPKNRKVKFRTNAVLPEKLLYVVVAYDENGNIDDILGEPLLLEELEKEIQKEENQKRKSKKEEHLTEIEELKELILIEADTDDGFSVSLTDWSESSKRSACEELLKDGKIALLSSDIFSKTYIVPERICEQ